MVIFSMRLNVSHKSKCIKLKTHKTKCNLWLNEKKYSVLWCLVEVKGYKIFILGITMVDKNLNGWHSTIIRIHKSLEIIIVIFIFLFFRYNTIWRAHRIQMITSYAGCVEHLAHLECLVGVRTRRAISSDLSRDRRSHNGLDLMIK